MTEKRIAVKIWAGGDQQPEWGLVDPINPGLVYPFGVPNQEYILTHMVHCLGDGLVIFSATPEEPLSHGREPVQLQLSLAYDAAHTHWLLHTRLGYDGNWWATTVSLMDEPQKPELLYYLKIHVAGLTRRLERYLEDKKKAR